MTRVLETLHRRDRAGAVAAVSLAGGEPGALQATLQRPDRVSRPDRARARQQAAGSEPTTGPGADDPVDRQPVRPLKPLDRRPGQRAKPAVDRAGREPAGGELGLQ